jgi:hypothetical protein
MILFVLLFSSVLGHLLGDANVSVKKLEERFARNADMAFVNCMAFLPPL